MMAKPGAIEIDYGMKSTMYQILMSTISNSALIPTGVGLGFSAIALPYMVKPNEILYVTSDQASWIAGLMAIFSPIGSLSSGAIMDFFGRKKGLILLNIPAVLGWLCIAIKPSLYLVYIGRILMGFAGGLSSTPSTVYITECSTPSLRGLLITSASISLSLGITVVYAMGLFLRENWQLVAGLSCVFPIISAVTILCFLPESPVWLIRQGRYREASESLQLLRGRVPAEQIQNELDDMIDKLKNTGNNKNNFLSTLKAFSRPESYKPFILMNTFFFFQQMTGIFIVIFYAVDVVQEAGVKSDPYVIAVGIGATRLFSTFLAGWMSKKYGRRITSIISGVGMSVSLLVLSSHLYMNQTNGYDNNKDIFMDNMNSTNENITNKIVETVNENGNSTSILPVVTILVYILTGTLGFLTLPWAMIGEIYPVRVRGVASGANSCITYLISFTLLKLYPTMLNALNKHGMFFLYGIMAFCGTIFVYFFLPETQGKTLAEIEQYFCKKKRRGNSEEEGNLHNSTKMIVIKSASKQSEN